MQLVLLSGVSGSGKSVALKALEDAGYFCVDNLPPGLIRSLVDSARARGEQSVAISADARSRVVRATEAGVALRAEAQRAWKRSQLAVNALLGNERVMRLHALLDECTALLDASEGETDGI